MFVRPTIKAELKFGEKLDTQLIRNPKEAKGDSSFEVHPLK